MDGGQAGKSRGSALEKALRVLEAVTDQPQAIGLPDIAARLGLPRQTVHRVLQQLEKAGLVDRDPLRDRYAVGAQLSELALATLYSKNQSAPIHDILQQLVNDVQETCNIGILRGMEYVYLERIECDWPLRIHLQAGSSVPAHCSAGGKAMLAYLPADFRARLLASADLSPATENSIIDVEELEAACAQVREVGYALNIEELATGIAAVGVPILDRSGRALAALAIHGPLVRISEERAISLVPKLRTAARKLAQAWGLVDEG
jgi:IclR family acetate operon transcriptional repressor